jgi:hypothetical protein
LAELAAVNQLNGTQQLADLDVLMGICLHNKVLLHTSFEERIQSRSEFSQRAHRLSLSRERTQNITTPSIQRSTISEREEDALEKTRINYQIWGSANCAISEI